MARIGERELKVVLRAKDMLTGVMKKATKNVRTAMDKMRKHWIAAAIAMTAAILALRKAWTLAFSAAQFAQQEVAFAHLAASHGESSDQIIENLRRISVGTLSTAEIMESAGTALLLGIPAGKLNEMMEIARASARITGQTIAAAFNDIAKGMGRQSKLILDNLGILVSADKANKEYAKTMGIVGRSLTDAERKQAFFNATMDAGREIVQRINVEQLTAAEGMLKFKAAVEELKIWFGKVLIATVAYVEFGLMAFSTGIHFAQQQALEFISKLVALGETLPWVGDGFKKANEFIKAQAQFEADAAAEAFFLAEAGLAVARSQFAMKDAIEITGRSLRQALKDLGDLPKAVAAGSAGADLILMGRMQERLITIQTFKDAELDIYRMSGLKEAEIAKETAETVIAFEKQASSLRLQRAKVGFQLFGKMMDVAFTATGGKLKALFLIQKAAAVGSAIVATHQAAAQALAIPPAPNFLMKSLALASGYASVAAIVAQTFGSLSGASGGKGGGAVGGGIVSAPTPLTTPTFAPLGGEEAGARGVTNVNITVPFGADKELWAQIFEDNIKPAMEEGFELGNLVIQTR
jgi:hypothetical protein